jgi:hypothetical protein
MRSYRGEDLKNHRGTLLEDMRVDALNAGALGSEAMNLIMRNPDVAPNFMKSEGKRFYFFASTYSGRVSYLCYEKGHDDGYGTFTPEKFVVGYQTMDTYHRPKDAEWGKNDIAVVDKNFKRITPTERSRDERPHLLITRLSSAQAKPEKNHPITIAEIYGKLLGTFHFAGEDEIETIVGNPHKAPARIKDGFMYFFFGKGAKIEQSAKYIQWNNDTKRFETKTIDTKHDWNNHFFRIAHKQL